MVIHPLAITLEPQELFRAISELPGAFFLDTGQPGGADLFSFMGFRPRMQLRIGADRSALVDGRRTHCPPFPLAILDRFLERPEAASSRLRVPFAGGLLVALGYEAKNWIENLPDPPAGKSEWPVVAAALYDFVICYSHRARKYFLASWHLSPDSLRKEAASIEDLARAAQARTWDLDGSVRGACSLQCNMTRREYLDRVERIKRYIENGEVYQVNFCQQFEAGISQPLANVYLRMRRSQPVPFGFYANWGDFEMAANSPERFLRKRGRWLTTCPIKGTRGRSGLGSEAAEISALRGDPKEAAEHIMIVDVERNDLGRVCATGSVRVRKLAHVRTFSLLYHLESVIEGRIAQDLELSEILRATFPSGSVTGAPKIRAMEIIAELEPDRRGFYTGAFGYLDHSGNFDLAMGIRTIAARGARATYCAGGGIVADSVPEREYEECLVKAQAFFLGLGEGVAAASGFVERPAEQNSP